MKKLQEIDPLPIDMVEVTVEDTWERMMRIIQKQQTDIENLKKRKKIWSPNIRNRLRI